MLRWTLVLMGFYCVSTAAAHELRIEHVTVVSPERTAPLRDASIKITDDKITALVQGGFPKDPSGKAEVIDGKGLYLTPGLIDSHVHTSDLPGIDITHGPTHEEIADAIEKQTPRSYLYFGYTTLIDLISTPERIEVWNVHEAHPTLYFCGGAQIPGGYPPIEFVSERDRRSLMTYMIVQRGEEAKAPPGIDPATHTPEAVVARMKHDGAVCLKTFRPYARPRRAGERHSVVPIERRAVVP
jgi:hypothetical protein